MAQPPLIQKVPGKHFSNRFANHGLRILREPFLEASLLQMAET